jgi:hypothetical protein
MNLKVTAAEKLIRYEQLRVRHNQIQKDIFGVVVVLLDPIGRFDKMFVLDFYKQRLQSWYRTTH